MARSVPVAGKRGLLGSTAAWQPVSAETLYPAIESARLRSREGTRSARSGPGFSFWEGHPLIFDLLRIVDEMRPECFIFENVPNLTQQFKQTFQLFLDEANAIGFFSKWALLKACDYGVPTQRTRVFVVGWKKSAMNDDFYFPDATHVDPKDCPLLVHPGGNLKPFRFVSNVLEGLPNVKTPEASGFFNHTGRNHRPETIEHLKTVPLGKQINKSFRYRAPWNGLSQSLTAGLDNSTKSQIHPHFHREMSVREYARLHLFPDSWVFSGTHHNGIKQVANSVPIPLGEAVLSAVIQMLDKKPA